MWSSWEAVQSSVTVASDAIHLASDAHLTSVQDEFSLNRHFYAIMF